MPVVTAHVSIDNGSANTSHQQRRRHKRHKPKRLQPEDKPVCRRHGANNARLQELAKISTMGRVVRESDGRQN
eukprot:scaffold147533_cov17-Tisochrysis_lutea.AAC.1